jgi:hypothetical protein
LIGHIARNDIEVKAGDIIDQEGAVSVVDQAAGRRGLHHTNPIVFGELVIELPLNNLQIPCPEQKPAERQDDQTEEPIDPTL